MTLDEAKAMFDGALKVLNTKDASHKDACNAILTIKLLT